MPIFTAQDQGRLDFSILQNGPVVLYWNPNILQQHIAGLHRETYKIVKLDCSRNSSTFCLELGRRMKFWGEWRGDLNALNDYVYNLDFPESGCLALVLSHFDALHAADAQWTWGWSMYWPWRLGVRLISPGV